jgi:hypothetical protein
MEAILAGHAENTDVLPDSLSLQMDKTGSFVLQKREAVTYGLGSSYSPDGVRMIQIPFGSTTEWLDSNTI